MITFHCHTVLLRNHDNYTPVNKVCGYKGITLFLCPSNPSFWPHTLGSHLLLNSAMDSNETLHEHKTQCLDLIGRKKILAYS